ncbi:MAG: hypothetical protein RL722_3020, partial [Pseudomonadota bacterium]
SGLLRRHAEAEQGRIAQAVSQRTAAWAQLLEHSLPPVSATDAAQRSALLDWASRLRLAVALDAADGRRIATSDLYADVEAHEGAVVAHPTRVELSDGRALWLVRPRQRLRVELSGEGSSLIPPSRPAFVDDGGMDPAGLHPGGDRPLARGGFPSHERDWIDRTIERLLPGPTEVWRDEASRLLVLMMGIFLAIALGSYPVVRRLTRRLEDLKRGVDTFGAGRLDHRVPEEGRDEVASLAGSFNRAAERVEALVRSNRSLLANASHELRSPLARMKMAISLFESVGTEQRQRLRAEIERDIRELDALVEEVLLASRLDGQASIVWDRVRLLDLGADEAARVGAQTELVAPAGARVEVHGDERLLRRALRNLLENARRYGGADILLRFLPWGADGWRAEVCDRGSGVPEAERQRIFEPFYRLPGHSEQAGGVGLGLALVRQIAERHGGRVRCEGRDGGGSCFVLELPGNAPEDIQELAAAEAASAVRPR